MRTRLMTYLLAVALVAGSAGSMRAVEKKAKDSTSTAQPAQPTKPKDAKPADPKAKPNAGKTEQKKYDNFVDRNGNGVDDRHENLKKKDGK